MKNPLQAPVLEHFYLVVNEFGHLPGFCTVTLLLKNRILVRLLAHVLGSPSTPKQVEGLAWLWNPYPDLFCFISTGGHLRFQEGKMINLTSPQFPIQQHWFTGSTIHPQVHVPIWAPCCSCHGISLCLHVLVSQRGEQHNIISIIQVFQDTGQSLPSSITSFKTLSIIKRNKKDERRRPCFAVIATLKAAVSVVLQITWD